ncbi:hypothetical protein SDRG_07784 [Saprolegnia diclina VS20]|uniref:Essential protein Yae1 N-terminal domain-containing protein n=1 Tax=Saprolegnia diclina (strain VS20) TaxID=1156394 RepID=T0Q9B6_SAPDV|nr:hypothetical protein SDRG_07784 [Saprolegnia diclina VS20]XP_008617165.1 hypothetical protein SDRG_12861 [Saprolegnia diclina VS20]EQC29398.1 hypothetical protein SDRG_12861 [Saprolegnia diclina VS20]EQC34454.1 hypothetical protein SDRG_07784 [Saprolegnia diclina VS20]|eukprot:XP_008611860.1 hypothetical protein SDRG_07784 [Saprolegnia diclina VS20]
MDDVFDLVDRIEEQCIVQGHAQGVEEGRRLGFQEGNDLGEVKGYEIGSEVGFYHGCYLLWSAMLLADASSLPPRAVKSIESLGQRIRNYALVNSLDEKIHMDLQLIRAKFKVVTSLLGHPSLVFNEQNVLDHKNMSF